MRAAPKTPLSLIAVILSSARHQSLRRGRRTIKTRTFFTSSNCFVFRRLCIVLLNNRSLSLPLSRKRLVMRSEREISVAKRMQQQVFVKRSDARRLIYGDDDD